MPYVKSRFKKDSLLILPTPSCFGLIESQVGETLNLCTFKKTKHSNKSQLVNAARVSYDIN